jgi:hypothetical protein
MPVLFIDEEYGYKHWIADLTDAEWEALQKRWRTIKGMNCLVPVRFLVPQAKLIEWEDADSPDFGKKFHECRNRATVFAHFHEEDDSRLSGCDDYEIPEIPGDYRKGFEIDGRYYTDLELLDMLRSDQANPPELA